MSFKAIIRLSVLIAVLVSALAVTGVTHAATYFWKETFTSVDCLNTGEYVKRSPFDSWNYPDGAVLILTLRRNGVVYGYHEFTLSPGDTQPGDYYGDAYTVHGSSYPATFTESYQLYVDGKLVFTYLFSVNCAGVGPGVFSVTYTEGDGSGIPGPSVPDGFVLRTITCTAAVFSEPGGSPVGSNQVTAGQTWYINPTPVKDASGKSWTQIFVGGYGLPFIPTSCIQ